MGLTVESAHSSDKPCLAQILKPVKTETKYVSVDLLDPTFRVEGILESSGTLSLSFQLRDIEGNRSVFLSGKEEFQRIMEHFGKRVKRIQGTWLYGDNLAEFNRLVGPPHGLDVFEAAAQTWTGKNAAKYGYTEVKILKLTKSIRGDYNSVKVIFEKPIKTITIDVQ